MPDPATVKPRSQWMKGPHLHVRVLGVVEGWVVYRRKGCAPALLHINDFIKTYTEVPHAHP